MIKNKQLNSDEIFLLLKKQLNKSYAPYSSFYVASILETKINDKYKYYFGNNIENLSFSLTICAERNVICNYLSNKEDDEKILNLYVLANNKSNDYKEIIHPCGACLGVLNEFFNENNTISCYSIYSRRKDYKMLDLMPEAFKWKGK